MEKVLLKYQDLNESIKRAIEKKIEGSKRVKKAKEEDIAGLKYALEVYEIVEAYHALKFDGTKAEVRAHRIYRDVYNALVRRNQGNSNFIAIDDDKTSGIKFAIAIIKAQKAYSQKQIVK